MRKAAQYAAVFALAVLVFPWVLAAVGWIGIWIGRYVMFVAGLFA